MSTNLENFQPKLRPGRVIPQGSTIIFESEQPYNQITLPMALADLVLLCSGKFKVGEIIERIYKKQGIVHFRDILKGIHRLHQGGFFENGHELVLNSHLKSWMTPKVRNGYFTRRFKQKITLQFKSRPAFFALSVLVLLISALGMYSLPHHPMGTFSVWMQHESFLVAALKIFACSSIALTFVNLVRGAQLILLTGKIYNISVRLSPLGLYLHLGNEVTDLLERRKDAVTFHFTQILASWSCLFFATSWMTAQWVPAMIFVTFGLSFLQLNPFIRSDGFRLIKAFMLGAHPDFVNWHFEDSALVKSLERSAQGADINFARVCSLWGMAWISSTIYGLQVFAVTFGPNVLDKVAALDSASVMPAVGLVVWLVALYMVVQSFIETLVASLMHSSFHALIHRLKHSRMSRKAQYNEDRLIKEIQNLPLFSHFQDQNLKRIVEKSEVVMFRRGSALILQGDTSRELYVLLNGTVEVSRNWGNRSEWLTELSPVAIFGEAALLGEAPRAAQVLAKTDVTVLRIPVVAIRQVAEASQVIRQLEDFRNAILVNQFFTSSPIFRSLSNEAVDFLCSRGALDYFDKGTKVYAQGSNSNSIYLILRGAVEIQVNGLAIKRFNQGNFFGEIALIGDLPRTETVVALSPCVFFQISAESFWEVLVQHIDLGIFMETVSERRLKDALEVAQPARQPDLKKTGSDSK